jgi:hypothetical protein
MAVPVVLFAVLGAVLGLARWELEPSHASGDAFWYARTALEYRGASREAATSAAATFIVGEGRGDDPDVYVRYARTVDPRYPAIFESRPFYPLVASALIPVAGLRAGMALAALAAGVAFAMAFGWFVERLTGSLAAALGAISLAFVLPSGRWFAFMYADGWMLVFAALALASGCIYLGDTRARYLAAFLASIVLLYLTKPANGAALVVGFVLLGLGAWLAGSPNRRPAATLATASLLISLTHLAAFAFLDLPGLETTLQDMFTLHFSQPDVANPLERLVWRDLEVAGMALRFPLQEPITVLLVAGLVAPLVAIRRAWAAAWLIGGFVAVLTVLAHPVTSEFPRLLAPIWITAALGGGLWITRAQNSLKSVRAGV